jgi:hypothetical protein
LLYLATCVLRRVQRAALHILYLMFLRLRHETVGIDRVFSHANGCYLRWMHIWRIFFGVCKFFPLSPQLLTIVSCPTHLLYAPLIPHQIQTRRCPWCMVLHANVNMCAHGWRRRYYSCPVRLTAYCVAPLSTLRRTPQWTSTPQSARYVCSLLASLSIPLTLVWMRLHQCSVRHRVTCVMLRRASDVGFSFSDAAGAHSLTFFSLRASLH